jgi:hypothetical protein
VVITLSVCERFLCEEPDCPQRSFDERFEGIDRGGASARALAFFAYLARGRATRAVARDLGVPEHYLRIAVGVKRRAAHERHRGAWGRTWPSTSAACARTSCTPPCSVIPTEAWSSSSLPGAMRRPCCSSPASTAMPSAPRYAS